MYPVRPRSLSSTPRSKRSARVGRIFAATILGLALSSQPSFAHQGVSASEVAAKTYAIWLKRLKRDEGRSAQISNALSNAQTKLASLRPFLADPSFNPKYKLEVLNTEVARADAFLSKNARGIDSLARSFFESKLNSLKKAVESGESRVISDELADLSRFIAVTKKTFETPIF